MSRRFPTPLFGVEQAERRSEVFVSLALETDGCLAKPAFVSRARSRLSRPDGGVYSEAYLTRILSTYVQLGVVRQTDDGIGVWQFARDWRAGDIDFETFLWYALKKNWVIEGQFPEGIEGLGRLHTVLRNAESPLERGALSERLADQYGYEFNDEGIRGYPTLLVALGAAAETEDGYVARAASRWSDRFRQVDLPFQLEQWLKREGANTTPPPTRVKRDLAKYYMYRESGGLGQHRRLFDTVRRDYLADTTLDSDPSEPRIRRDERYVAAERKRRTLRESIRERFPGLDGNALAGLSTDVLERIDDADTEREAYRIKSAAGEGVSRTDIERMAGAPRETYTFPESFELYDWQREAAKEWFDDGPAPPESGIAQVVTGAGKTVMALEVVRRWLDTHPDGVVTVLVPTRVLMRQWLTEFVEKLNVPAEHLGWAGGGHKDGFDGDRRVLVSIVNSAVKDDYLRGTLSDTDADDHLLVADECHRYTGDVFSNVFDYPRTASLGLSATPLSTADSDEYTEADELLLDELGDIYYRLSYQKGLDRGLIPPFRVNYIAFDLTEDERIAYDTLSQKVSDAVSDIEARYGSRLYELSGGYAQKLQVIMQSSDGPTPTIADFFRFTSQRRELVADAVARQAITLHLLDDAIDEEKQTIVFQERIEQLERIVAPTEQRGRNPRTGALAEEDTDRQRLYELHPGLKTVDQELERQFFSADYRPVMYHSGHQREAWNDFAIEWFGDEGFANAMLSVKALIEGVDVPSADVGIVRVSSGSVRQRIQTLGRVLRTGEDPTKRSELHVLYARDTVDENIFHDHDWEAELADAEVRHLRWAVEEDAPLEGELVPGEPPELPGDGPFECPDEDDLEPGDAYPARRRGYEFSVDAEGHPFEKTSEGRRFIVSEEVEQAAQLVHRVKGGGTVTINECNHAVTVVDGDPVYVGTLDPETFEYDEPSGGLTGLSSSLTGDADDYDDVF